MTDGTLSSKLKPSHMLPPIMESHHNSSEDQKVITIKGHLRRKLQFYKK